MVSPLQELLEADSLALTDDLKARPPVLDLDFNLQHRYVVDMEDQAPHVLSLHIKCRQGHLKILRGYQKLECWVIRPDGQLSPLELTGCRLMKHDLGRGFWTYVAWIQTLLDDKDVVRLRLSDPTTEEVIF
jgi:uncharacterized protein (DUF2249 family)